jgi:hypothetical protein
MDTQGATVVPHQGATLVSGHSLHGPAIVVARRLAGDLHAVVSRQGATLASVHSHHGTAIVVVACRPGTSSEPVVETLLWENFSQSDLKV